MINIVELFSGVGSQVKALKNIEAPVNVLATVEWDIHAIIAYDLIHNGPQNIYPVSLSLDEMRNELSKYNFSHNGKVPFKEGKINKLNSDLVKSLYIAIKRTKNLVDIQSVSSKNLPQNIDIMTYSFPCQDLSISGNWHGNKGGIDRSTENRSNMLWQVGRILHDLKESKCVMPRFLLMENVTNIISKTHNAHFEEWKSELEGMGYINKLYILNANDFNNPQKRNRAFLISIFFEDVEKKKKILNYFDENNLQKFAEDKYELKNYLRLDYENETYREEALKNQPNDTESRKKILKDNLKIIKDNKIEKAIPTITTKQDRHPNSGVINVNFNNGKAPYRTLTPRECFLLMGFHENDYDSILNGNFPMNKRNDFFTNENLMRLAGNSIVVNVLEEIFKQIVEINSNIFNKEF